MRRRTRRATPDQIEQVIVMRSAGWPLSTICVEVDLSISTIQRICKRHKTKSGELQEEMVNAAKMELLNDCVTDDRLRAHYKEMLLDSISQSRLGREKLLEALEVLNPSTIQEAALTMRAVAAHATATKSYSDMMRQLLPGIEVEPELEEFVIKILSDADVLEMRAEQEREQAMIMGTEESGNVK